MSGCCVFGVSVDLQSSLLHCLPNHFFLVSPSSLLRLQTRRNKQSSSQKKTCRVHFSAFWQIFHTLLGLIHPVVWIADRKRYLPPLNLNRSRGACWQRGTRAGLTIVATVCANPRSLLDFCCRYGTLFFIYFVTPHLTYPSLSSVLLLSFPICPCHRWQFCNGYFSVNDLLLSLPPLTQSSVQNGFFSFSFFFHSPQAPTGVLFPFFEHYFRCAQRCSVFAFFSSF